MCVHLIGDHAGMHLMRIPGAFIPGGPYVPASHKKVCFRASCRDTWAYVSGSAAAGAAPQPYAVSPGECLQVTCEQGGMQLETCMCLLPTERCCPLRLVQYICTRIENVGECDSNHRPGYLGSTLHSHTHSLQHSQHSPCVPGRTLAQATKFRAAYKEIINKYRLSLSARNIGSPRLKALHSKAPPGPLLFSFFNGFTFIWHQFLSFTEPQSMERSSRKGKGGWGSSDVGFVTSRKWVPM